MKVGNAGEDPGDPLEGRGEQTNGLDGGNMETRRNLVNMSTKHIRIAELAKEDKERKFFSIAHFLTQDALYEAFGSLRKDAGAGVDGVTYAEYETRVWGNIQKLHDRMKNGQYRAQPLRRVYIPKEDGRQRPISIPTVSAYCTSYNMDSESALLCFRILEDPRTRSTNSCSLSALIVIQYGEPALSLRASTNPRSIQ
jgi:hypothetical protein